MSARSTGLVSLMGQLPSCRYQKVSIDKEGVHHHISREIHLGPSVHLGTFNSSPKPYWGNRLMLITQKLNSLFSTCLVLLRLLDTMTG